MSFIGFFPKVLIVCPLQAKFNGTDHDMKVHIKECFKQFVYSDTTSMCPPPNQVKTKGVPKDWTKGSSKRPSYSHDERSTKRSPFLFEHAESRYSEIIHRIVPFVFRRRPSVLRGRKEIL
jgi:hypothetical protein